LEGPAPVERVRLASYPFALRSKRALALAQSSLGLARLIPLKDNLPTGRFPILTVLLIVVNVAVFVWQTQVTPDPQLEEFGITSGIDQSALDYGANPYRITHPAEEKCAMEGRVRPEGNVAEVVCEGQRDTVEGERVAGPIPLDQAAWWITLLVSMFMHGGILHLAGNMLFLWIFGNNVEDSMGRGRFLLFYVLAGLIAVYAQALVDTGSTVPTVGASGAVAGVLGAYALLYPHARVLTFVIIIFFVTLIEIPALIVLGIWFALQFIPAVGQTAVTDLAGGGGIAYFAHLAGFVFGLAAIKLFANRHRAGLTPASRYG
jgi:membrane associated rhomboid family serine protease